MSFCHGFSVVFMPWRSNCIQFDNMGWMFLIIVLQWNTLGALLITRLTLIPIWISNYIHHKIWNEIMHLFPNFNICSGMDKKFHPTVNWVCGFLFMLGLKLIHIWKEAPGHKLIVEIESDSFRFLRNTYLTHTNWPIPIPVIINDCCLFPLFIHKKWYSQLW